MQEEEIEAKSSGFASIFEAKLFKFIFNVNFKCAHFILNIIKSCTFLPLLDLMWFNKN